jgi:hypothetical protein
MPNTHQPGGEFVEMVRLLDTERPSSNTQLNVNTNDRESCIWRAEGGRMKLIVWNDDDDDDDKEGTTLTELGDWDEDREIAGLSTDHTATPRDLLCTVPTTFSFEEGLILITDPPDDELELEEDDNPPNTLTLTTGDESSTITTSKLRSHSRSSASVAPPPEVTADLLPLNDTVNLSPREMEEEEDEEEPWRKEEEFTLIDTREGDAEERENTSNESQLPR